MTAYDINKILYTNFFNNYDYLLFNSYIFKWESDFFAISKSGYVHEVEIKINKSDFKNDFKKKVYCGNTLKHDYLQSKKEFTPNKFWFACPKKLIYLEDIPYSNYGLIWIDKNHCKIIRNAKFLHKIKHLDNHKFTKMLLNKFYNNNIDLRYSLNLEEYDIKYHQRRIDEDYYYN